LKPRLLPAGLADAGDYFALISFGGCSSVISTTTRVYVNPIPDAPTVMSGDVVCTGEDITLSIGSLLDTIPGDIVSFDWYFAATNEWVATTTEPSFTLVEATADQSGDYYVIYTLNGCTAAASETTFVDITPLPTQIADAGVEETLCATNSYNLHAVPATVGIGTWTSLTGASIIDENDPETEVFNLQEGDNTFVWTLSSGGCEGSMWYN